MVGSAVIFLILESDSFFWKLLKISPFSCDKSVHGTSCFVIYDILLLLITAGIFILSLLTAIVKIILFLRTNKKL